MENINEFTLNTSQLINIQNTKRKLVSLKAGGNLDNYYKLSLFNSANNIYRSNNKFPLATNNIFHINEVLQSGKNKCLKIKKHNDILLTDKSKSDSILNIKKQKINLPTNYLNSIKSSAASIEAIIYENKDFLLYIDNKNSNNYYNINNLKIEGNLNKVLKNIAILFEMELSTFIIMNIYLDIYSEKSNDLFSWENIFLLIISASLCALKYNEDKLFLQKYYSSLIEISLDILISSEVSFANKIDFKFYVDKNLYDKYHDKMVKAL